MRYYPQAARPNRSFTIKMLLAAFVVYRILITPWREAVVNPTQVEVLPGSIQVSQPTIAWLPPSVSRWSGYTQTAAAFHPIDPAVLDIVIQVESCGDPSAVSPSGAIGLMQVMPATAMDIANRRSITDFDLTDLYDPAVNIDFGAWYLTQQLAAFGIAQDPDWVQSVSFAAAAYNGGPGMLSQHLQGDPMPNETVSYLEWVRGMWQERHQAESPTFVRWLEAGGDRLCAQAQEA